MSLLPRAVPPSINGWNAPYLDAEYERYLRDPASVSPESRAFFAGFELALAGGDGTVSSGRKPAVGQASSFQVAVDRLIESYRVMGHMAARLDPFGRERERPAALSLGHHGLSDADLDRLADASAIGMTPATPLREVVARLEETYCGSVGAEFMHIQTVEEREWLLSWFEGRRGRVELSPGERAHVLAQLLASEQFENFTAKRYPGDKRFSLEGGESLIPLLDRLAEASTELGVQEIVIGMAHRGRLNVLNNILGKTYAQIFTEFEDNWDRDFADGGGDVKYHRGYSGTRQYGNGRMLHLAMASNPSHLEAVDPIVLGRCRAKQRLRGDAERRRVIPVLVHGDAAIVGQGVVAECLNLSQLEGYTTGGTVHVVVNNMIGFTTLPEDGRSSRYCTDVAKFVEAPVLHVNGEDPEACVAAAQLAIEYRQRFRKDVFIDMWCYRRYGHNEQDEASFTQPVMAALIKRKPSVLKVYAERLLAEGVINEQDMEAIRRQLDDALEKAQEAAKSSPYDPTIDPGSARWSGLQPRYSHDPVETGASRESIARVCAGLASVPKGFRVNPKLKRLLESRANLPASREVSYADAESLAFGTLLLEGVAIRLSGQDCRRGTFSHRHAVLRDFETAEPYTPLNNMLPVWEPGSGEPFVPGKQQARFCVYDSPLSEFSVMGFDYGYSLADPNMLVIWEAQFGDFANGAQVIIDQFLASAESKWERWSGLVLLLPHGYEGAGPEHSSARVERFLTLCAGGNMQVAYPSTGAQIFHLLRRQVKRAFRKPLVVLTPKSLLRKVTSTIDELERGRFLEVIDDPFFEGPKGADRKGVARVILCAGKFYFELDERRREIGRTDVAIVRHEQFYPFHRDMLKGVLDRYPASAEVVWSQEEPRNAGAAMFVMDRLREELGISARYCGREASPTPAVGSKRIHAIEQESILSRAVGPRPSEGSGDSSPKQTKPVPAGA